MVYIENVKSGDENTSTTKVEFLFWKCENLIFNFYSDSSHCVIFNINKGTKVKHNTLIFVFTVQKFIKVNVLLQYALLVSEISLVYEY